MIKNPTVSIIMNCHNGAKYLKRSVKSIIDQSYQNWELIFWDNKSTDNSKKILLSFVDNRIKYFYSKRYNSLYKSRNLAISKANSTYISFLDVDDYWSKEKLDFQINYMIKNKFQISFSDLYVLYDINNKKVIYNKKKNYDTSTQSLLNNYKLGLLTCIVHKKFFKIKKFNNDFNIIGDFDYFVYLSYNNKIGYINKPLATYRVHSNNFSKKYSTYYSEILNWLKINKPLLKKKNLNLFFFYLFLIKLKIKSFF